MQHLRGGVGIPPVLGEGEGTASDGHQHGCSPVPCSCDFRQYIWSRPCPVLGWLPVNLVHTCVGTTSVGGAKAPWLPEFTETLRGRECIIIPDNDAPGWDRATRIARALLGSAARIRVLDLPK